MKNKNKKIKKMKKKKCMLIEKTKKIKDEMRIKKMEMRKSAERILDDGKYKNIEEIYQRVFSPEDLVFLSNNSSRINSLCSPSYKTHKFFYKKDKNNIYSYRNLKNSSNSPFFKIKKDLEYSY
jgi:hypothetical protein